MSCEPESGPVNDAISGDDAENQLVSTMDPGTGAPTMPRAARIWWLSGPLVALSWLATIIVLFLPAPYTTEAPGDLHETSDLLTIQQGVETFEHSGQFEFVTVRQTVGPSFGLVLLGWLDPTTDVFPTTVVSGDKSVEEERRFAAVLMSNSKQAAAYHALSLLGFDTQTVANGVFVNQVIKDSAADGKLMAGDVITAVDGDPIYTSQDLGSAMNTDRVGDTVVITVDRIGVDSEMDVKVRLGSHEVEGEKRAYLGIYMETRPRYVLPFTVDFDSGDVGGPSAGLAFTLSLVDQLSPEGIAKGNAIAVTGSVQLDGSVGPIGGIRQKTYAVIDSGADYFLVPEINRDEAEDVAGDKLQVIAVASVEDALETLEKLPAAS